MTLTASYQKIFSDDPKIGFFAQRDRFKDALDAGEVLPPAKNADDMQQVVTNSTVDGVLSVLFASLIIIVILDASRIWLKAIRAREPLPTTETPFVESKLWAPSGLIPTAEERAYMADLQTQDDGSVRHRARAGRHRRPRVTVKEILSGVRWYLREVSGETAYERYVEHVRREHPDAIVMSRRDFERLRQDDRNDNPRARCC